MLFQIESTRFRRFMPATDPSPIHEGAAVPEPGVEPEPVELPGTQTSSQFAYEHDLRDYLARNLHLIEPGLSLYEEEGVTGVEFPVGGRFVDILAIGSDGAYVVVVLKVSRGYDRTIGQLLRYLGWIERHHAEPRQPVRGVIVAKELSEDLRLACSRIAGVALFKYSCRCR